MDYCLGSGEGIAICVTGDSDQEESERPNHRMEDRRKIAHPTSRAREQETRALNRIVMQQSREWCWDGSWGKADTQGGNDKLAEYKVCSNMIND